MSDGRKSERRGFDTLRHAKLPKIISGDTISGFITGNASGNGKYVGKSIKDRTTDASASGSLAVSDLGTLSATNDCLIFNLVELGSSTTGHDVTAATNTGQFAIYFTGRLVRVNSDGTKIIHVQMYFAGCS